MTGIQKLDLRGLDQGNKQITSLSYSVQSGLKFTPLKEGL